MSGSLNPAPQPSSVGALVMALLVLFVTGCGQSGDEGTFLVGSADSERGELLALSCRVCHTFGADEEHLLGPNLHGVFGRSAASATGFEYSAALQEADFVWTPDRLDAWLAQPDDFLPGNNMTFAGFSSTTDRQALIDYLLQVTASGGPP